MNAAKGNPVDLPLVVRQSPIGEGSEESIEKRQCRMWMGVAALRSLARTSSVARGLLAGTALSATLAGCQAGRAPAPRGPSPEASERTNVGYQTKASGEITTAVSSVRQEELDEQRVQSIEQILRQRIPGLRLGYLPNGEVSVQLRGPGSFTASTEPLVVIDGRPTQPRELFQLSPLEIGRIDVLKDAAAAIYGMRGANGVILVATRRR
jgi:TonB-dependent SusC/RagA subfamily outer membrane receptor